jgi:cytochrome P450
MSPPVGSSPWRVVGLGGEVIAGLAIPQGCSVGTGVYSMHHNDRYFENPHEFIPERWLQDPHRRGSGNMTLNPAFMPFSTGPRSCIGQSLATAEVSLTVAILLWRYDLRAGNAGDHDIGGGKAVSGKENVGRTNPEEFQLIDRVLGLPQGPELEFRPRSVSQA